MGFRQAVRHRTLTNELLYYKLMFESSIKGLLIELKCQEAFISRGLNVLQPVSPDCRYDYAVEINGRFIRVQCKSSTVNKDDSKANLNENLSFRFQTANRNWNSGARKSYQGQIDYFYTWYEGNDYLIPIDEASKSSMTVRIDSNASTNNSSHWDDLYLFDNVLKNELEYSSKEEIRKIRKDYLEKMEARRKTRKGVCIICGGETSAPSISRCRNCYKKENSFENTHHITREELKELIRTMSFEEIGRRYKVDGNSIRKWCDSCGLPRRKVDINKMSDKEWEKI